MKQILYSLLFLGSLATFTGCEEADYQELIPQEYNKILYLPKIRKQSQWQSQLQ